MFQQRWDADLLLGSLTRYPLGHGDRLVVDNC